MNDKMTQLNCQWSMSILLNKKIEMNLINQNFVVVTNLKSIFNDLSMMCYLNDVKTYCYETYEFLIVMNNSWKHDRIFTDIFYAMNKDLLLIDVTLKLSNLIKKNIVMHFENKSWRYSVKSKTLKLMKSEKLMNEIRQRTIIYAIITTFASLTFSKIEINATTALEQYFYENSFEMSAEYKNFVDVFFDKNVKKLSKHWSNDRVIKNERREYFVRIFIQFINCEIENFARIFWRFVNKKLNTTFDKFRWRFDTIHV